MASISFEEISKNSWLSYTIIHCKQSKVILLSYYFCRCCFNTTVSSQWPGMKKALFIFKWLELFCFQWWSVFTIFTYLQYYQRAKKVVSNNHGLVDFAFRLVNSVLNPFTQPEWMLESLKVVMTFESVDKILWCDHSNENSLLVLSNGAICFQNFGKPNLGIFFYFCPCSHLALKGCDDDDDDDVFWEIQIDGELWNQFCLSKSFWG